MSRNDNLTNHEVYDSFFATDKQKREFQEAGTARKFLYFAICVVIALFVGLLEYSAVKTTGACFVLCVGVGFIVFLYAADMLPCGYLTAIISVIVSFIALVLMIENTRSGITRFDSILALSFAIADIGFILSGSNILAGFLVLREYTSRTDRRDRHKKQKARKAQLQTSTISLLVIACIGCLLSLASFIIGALLMF